MTTIRTATAAIVSGLLVAASGTFAWSGGNTDVDTPVVQKAANPAGATQLEVLIPIVKNPERHDPSKDCRSPGLYSNHDVVGDPQMCFLGRLGTQIVPGQTSGGGVF